MIKASKIFFYSHLPSLNVEYLQIQSRLRVGYSPYPPIFETVIKGTLKGFALEEG